MYSSSTDSSGVHTPRDLLGLLYVWAAGAFCCSRLSVSGLVGMTGPQSSWLPSPTYAEAAGHCLWDWVSRLLAA